VKQLRTEQNTPEVETDIADAASAALCPPHRAFSVDFEHGQHWVTCLDCGAQWSAIDSNDPNGFAFEQVTEGDEYCITEGL
jgi:hypothetical protein